MKKFNFLMVLGLMAAASANAQTTVASVGFEPSDQKYTTETAYTPGGIYGDWINRQDEDVWTEPYADDSHSGEYSFRMENTNSYTGNTWDRGFRVGNLQLKDNTAYRVSFWVKANPTYTNGEGGTGNTCLKSSLGIGHEYCDMPISTKSGLQYYYNYTNGVMTGDWKHFSYVTFFTNKADQDALSMNYTGKEDKNGEIPVPQGDPFPEEYFLIINMYNPGEYLLDDIKVEEGIAFNEATFVGDVVKLDFGYPTNIADLAKANNGSFSLDPSCATVTINGEPAIVEFVEGKSDGFLYIFLDEETTADDDATVVVSFTPAADCPILFNNDKRPSADVESDCPVIAFANETAYFDGSIDALPSAWSPASMVSSVPENESFEIVPASLTNIAISYDKAVSLTTASATLSWKDNYGEKTLDLSDGMSLSEDGKTINTAVNGSNLADGEYTFTLSGVANSYGIDCLEDQVITFALGEDSDTSVSEVVYASDFDNEMTGGIPQGWVTYNEAGFHIYGFNDEERTSQYNYDWGGTPGGGGARLYAGFTGDFAKAMYWGTRGTNEGYAEYGSQVKDWILEGGELDPEMPEGISLRLEPRKYQISFLMAAWKGEPTFNFTLEDLDGNVYARFNDILAAPNVNGAVGNVTGSVKCVTDFTVDKEGYYVLRFTAAEAQWQEYLLANVKLITMPSKAAYWKQQLAAALEKAEPILESAADESYDGETKTAFEAAINLAQTGHFTSPSEITALIAQLEELGAKMQTRVENIDAFTIALINAADQYGLLEGKYVNSKYATEAKELIDQYETTNPSDLSDEELAEVTPKIVNAAALMENVTSIVDVLTWRAYKAFQTAETLQVEDGVKYEALNLTDDDDEVIAKVNEASKYALYKLIADGEIADSLKTTVMYDNQKIAVDNIYVDVTSDDVCGNGVDFTCLVKNPHHYTFATNFGAAIGDNTVVGWNCTQYDGGSAHLSGDAATAAKPVVNSIVNAYGGGAEYKFYQTIDNMPVGIYDIVLNSRTALKNNPIPEEEGGDGVERGVFNAQNDSTGIWDKYVFAQIDEEEPIMVPFAAGSSWAGHPTLIRVEVKEGQKLTIGAVEHYTSGKASNHNYEATGSWDTNTFFGDTRLFFAAPSVGFDYAAAAAGMSDSIESVGNNASKATVGIYNVNGVRVSSLQKGINIVKMNNGSVQKVLVK